MQKVSVSGEVAKKLFESVREQTEKKCENCFHRNVACVKLGSKECKRKFKQKSITLILPESALMEKCPYDDETDECSPDNDEICTEYTDACEKEIEIKQGDSLEIVCGECEGMGCLNCNKDCSTCTECPDMTCKTCQGPGGFKVKVGKKLVFKVDNEFIDFPLGKNEENLDKLPHLLSLKLKDGKYLLLKGKYANNAL